jgi:hypothetical protein
MRVSHGFSYYHFKLHRPPGGLIVPSPGCRTLRITCKCGSRDGLDPQSAQVPLCPVRLRSLYVYHVMLVVFKVLVDFHKQNDDNVIKLHPATWPRL